MIRITSGSAKNKKIKIPDIEGIRVAQDKVRQAVFSIIGDKIEEATCLDLYAGSGIMGIEALSRGASYCDFVDKEYNAIGTIKDNLTNCNFENTLVEDENKPYILEKYNLHHMEAAKFTSKTPEKYDVIFADPFYNDLKLKHLFEGIEQCLSAYGIVVLLHGEALNIPQTLSNTNLIEVDSRKYGATLVSIIKHN